VARLARLAPGGRRYALANQTDGSGYEAPTRWVADVAIAVEPHIHAVLRSRELAARALGYTYAAATHFGLKLPAAPAKINDHFPKGRIAFVHGTSRADKEWPLSHWVALGQRLNTDGYQLLLPHGTAAELATSQAIAEALNRTAADSAVVPPALALDALTDELGQCAGVIGVDSGVSHIAVALDLPHVQIYNFDTAWRTGPETSSRQISVFAQPAPDVEAIWQAWLACSAAGAAA
jgi:heptosyltransferase-1